MIAKFRELDAVDSSWILENIPEIHRRTQLSDDKWELLTERLVIELSAAEKTGYLSHLRDTSVYVAGSMARWEANDDSDLDIMILNQAQGSAPLTKVQRAHTLALVDRIRHETGFRPFSRGGDFVQFHSVDDLGQGIGAPHDNSTNQFTARMMLLLNGVALINDDFHQKSFDLVLDSYWRQVSDRSEPFMPVYLLNDIRRWWLELCLNFEKQNPPEPVTGIGSPPGAVTDGQAQRRLSNLKLRYSRVLGPFSALMLILFVSNHEGVTYEACRQILSATPVERLLYLRRVGDDKLARSVEELLVGYDRYLALIKGSKSDVKDLVKSAQWRTIKASAYDFGDKVHAILKVCGDEKPIQRYLVV
jgi:predicted nucleotidyltransferase